MPRKVFLVVILTALVSVLSFRAARHISLIAFAAEPVAITPFTAQTTDVQFSPAGIQQAIDVRTTAVNSAGTQVDILETSDGKDVGNFSLLDLNKGVRISVDPATESITTYPMNGKMVGIARQLLKNCADSPTGVHRSIWGHVTFETIEDHQFGTTGLHSSSWIAPYSGPQNSDHRIS